MNIDKKFTASINYIMKLPVAIICETEDKSKKHNGIVLSENELIADSQDEIKFVAHFDKDSIKTDDLKNARITHAELVIDNEFETPASDFEVILSDGTKPGKLGKLDKAYDSIKGIIRSKKPMFYTSDKNTKLKLIVRGVCEKNDPSATTEKIFVKDGILNISAKFYKLFMWVLPGQKIHTSEIWAAVRLLPQLDTTPNWESVQGISLSAKISEGNEYAILETANEQTTAKQNLGFAKWIIKYTGNITWDNMLQANITVKVGLANKDEEAQDCISYSYNIGSNMSSYARSLDEAAGTLCLHNPFFDQKALRIDLPKIPENSKAHKFVKETTDTVQQELMKLIYYLNEQENVQLAENINSADVINKVAETVESNSSNVAIGAFDVASNAFANFLLALSRVWPQSYGPFNNVLEITGLLDDKYVCSEMAERIFDWSAERKFGKQLIKNTAYSASEIERAQTMNGIEIAIYSFAPFHVFFGFYPSNPTNSIYARFIDPWWEQNYNSDTAVLTWEKQAAKIVLFMTPLIVLGGFVGALTTSGSGVTLLNRLIISIKNIMAGGTALSLVPIAVTDIGSKLIVGEYVFYVGQLRKHYMSVPDMYNHYGDGSVEKGWAGKLISSGLLNNETPHDKSLILNF